MKLFKKYLLINTFGFQSMKLIDTKKVSRQFTADSRLLSANVHARVLILL